VPGQLLDVLLRRPDFHTFSYLGDYFIRFNVTRKPFDDPRVRQALALAIDKERIVKKSPGRENNPHRISCRRARLITLRPKGWAMTRRGQKNYWQRPVIPAAGISAV